MNLGSDRALVVHGSDGLDEITISGSTHVASLENSAIRTFEIAPEDVGIDRVEPQALRGGDASANAAALRSVLEGKKGPFRDVAIFNAAAGLVVAGKAKDFNSGVALARHTIDSGEAEGTLNRLIAVSNA
jgi:anthranilate phosphoribosyltransferase